MASKNALYDFYVKLNTDPELWSDFRVKPREILDAQPLSDREKHLLMHGPPDELKKEVERGLGPDAPCLIIGFIIW